jgi:TPR repeat protein
MKLSMLVLAAALACAASRAASSGELDDARWLYEEGRYGEAQAKLVAIAQAGDAQAQELLGFMYAFGPQLYPGTRRDLRVAQAWFDQAARRGRPVARYMYCALSHRSTQQLNGRYCFDHVVDAVEPPRKF